MDWECIIVTHVEIRLKVDIQKSRKKMSPREDKHSFDYIWLSKTMSALFPLSFFSPLSFYRPKYYGRPFKHSKVADRGNSHNIPCWLLWQSGSQMHLTTAGKPKPWSKNDRWIYVSTSCLDKEIILCRWDFVLFPKVRGQSFCLTYLFAYLWNLDIWPEAKIKCVSLA